MRLKDLLVLRKIAGRNIIVPIGRRTREVHQMINLSDSAAYLWDFMKEEFTVESLTEKILERFYGVTEEKARMDIEKLIEVLKRNHLLENQPGEETVIEGSVRILVKAEEVPEEMKHGKLSGSSR